GETVERLVEAALGCAVLRPCRPCHVHHPHSCTDPHQSGCDGAAGDPRRTPAGRPAGHRVLRYSRYGRRRRVKARSSAFHELIIRSAETPPSSRLWNRPDPVSSPIQRPGSSPSRARHPKSSYRSRAAVIMWVATSMDDTSCGSVTWTWTPAHTSPSCLENVGL